jgi:protein-S-isoprenylcysteine O-methyltransferase Ste14
MAGKLLAWSLFWRARFVFPAIMLLLVHFVYIPNEEKELKTMFGEEYLDYMKLVRKWI